MIDWSRYAPYFAEAEFRCKQTGKCDMEPAFLDRLMRLRIAYGNPMVVTSGYRDRTHAAEVGKRMPGAHVLGRAVDVSVSGGDAFRLVQFALEHGFTGIGVKQKGAGRFIHLDDVPNGPIARPMIWSY